ncbi:MAG: dihydroorotate dehydrogenase electron transfer subunit, partial [Lachnospiraceae bacterium]|nr:dihydroorotate dehydrogenase electron transfer subunit [Lachnospiraceae bacterium]
MAKRKETARIYRQEMLANDIFSLTIETSMAKEAHAGQFLGIYIEDASRLLARPISICDVDAAKGLIRMGYRISGEGTRKLSGYQRGKALEVLGVLGNGYDIRATEGKRTIVIGGGIGIPPMLFAAKSIPGEKEIVLGYADEQTFLRDEFEKEAKTYIA